MNNYLSQISVAHFRRLDVGRVVLFAVAVGAAWYLGSGFARLYREWQLAAQPPAAHQSTAADFNAMISVLPLAGQWSFAELDWDLRSHVMKRSSVVSRFETLATTPPGERAADLPDVSQELFDYVTKLKIQPVDRAGNQVYALDKPTFKAELVLRDVAGKMKTVGLGVGFPTTADDWQVFELTPQQLSDPTGKESIHLLPLPADSRRSGGRFADDGTLLLELVSLASKPDMLLAQWKEAGWEVRPSGLGGRSAFSYLCARGDEVVYAWSANPGNVLHNLMLVRTPDASDTKKL